jgi:ATP phosphoribosyltransferase regulatory subunit
MRGQGPLAADRAALVEKLRAAPPAELIAQAGPHLGLRTQDEIAARVAALLEDADAAPVPEGQAQALDALLSLAGPARAALAQMRAMRWDAITPALDRLEARLDALDAHGVNTAALPFEASFGRTTMEYYDGFVFGFIARDDLPPVASGGRYDALTAVLGQTAGVDRAIPAVGGVIRPEMLAALEGA